MSLGSCPLRLRIDKTTEYWGFPHSSAGKESASKPGDPSLIPGSGRSPGGERGCPLQYSGLENPMERVRCDFHFHFSLSLNTGPSWLHQDSPQPLVNLVNLRGFKFSKDQINLKCIPLYYLCRKHTSNKCITANPDVTQLKYTCMQKIKFNLHT